MSRTVITDDNIHEYVTKYINYEELPEDLIGSAENDWNVSIGDWDVSQVTNMDNLFSDRHFNQPIGQWNVSNVTSMMGMFFDNYNFNQPIGNWNVSNVTSMSQMFLAARTFNQPIGEWNVSNVNDMCEMFMETRAFNQPIGQWNVSNVTNMRSMFMGATAFNQPIGDWDVSHVTDMVGMFENARAFNQPIGQWNVSNVTNMAGMFHRARSFNQPLGQWIMRRRNQVRQSAVIHLAPVVAHVAPVAPVVPAPALVRIARTIQDYMSMCLTSDKTADVCRDSICQVCQEKFIVRGHLIRPVMFHRSVNSSGKETWVHPVHPEEQVQWGSQGPRGMNTCMECRDELYIPASLRNDIEAHRNEVIEGSEATSRALRLQSAFRGHRTRKVVTGNLKIRKAREQRASQQAKHDFIARMGKNSGNRGGGKNNKKHVRTLRRLRKTRRNGK